MSLHYSFLRGEELDLVPVAEVVDHGLSLVLQADRRVVLIGRHGVIVILILGCPHLLSLAALEGPWTNCLVVLPVVSALTVREDGRLVIRLRPRAPRLVRLSCPLAMENILEGVEVLRSLVVVLLAGARRDDGASLFVRGYRLVVLNHCPHFVRVHLVCVVHLLNVAVRRLVLSLPARLGRVHIL